MSNSSAVRQAHEDEFDGGVRLASLEWQQALDTPSLRTQMSVAAIVRLAKGIALVAPLGGVLAPVGGSGADVFSGTGMMSPDLARLVVVICFWVAVVGQAWALVDWWRLGRPRDGNGIAAAFLAVAAAAGALWWHSWGPEPTTLLTITVPIIATGLLGAVALVARLVGSRKWSMRDVSHTALGLRLHSLPDEEQQALLAERREILDALYGRNLIDEGLAQRAATARLGDWWLLDNEREAAGNGRGPVGAARPESPGSSR